MPIVVLLILLFAAALWLGFQFSPVFFLLLIAVLLVAWFGRSYYP